MPGCAVPRLAWAWSTVQSYKWQATQHINVLELAAFFNFIKCVVRENGLVGQRFFHVLDSRVSSCVVAKGRSSSTMLNRILRLIGALLLAADIYVLPLWTISGWNYADASSRVYSPAPSTNDG